MPVTTFDDLTSRISAVVGTDDVSLALLEDMKDTFDSYKDTEDWKNKYNELDENWRNKYKERFTSGTTLAEEKESEEKETDEKKSFEDLFENEQ